MSYTPLSQSPSRHGSVSTESGRWNPSSWQSKPCAQAINYEEHELAPVMAQIRSMPDLVSSEEIDTLNDVMAEAARGQVFLIQGGDCAEAFNEVQGHFIDAKWGLLVEQARRLTRGMGLPVLPIGRIAGQYSKPRSSCTETLSCGTVVPAFRGDNINGQGTKERSFDPQRMLLGSHLAGASMLMLRMNNQGMPLFTSHEALNLHLESAWTRYRYNTSAHMVWVGERTRQLDGAHVEYLRGIRNPIGIKVGPTADPLEIVELMHTLNPSRTPGRIVLITRLGYKNVEAKLPNIVKKISSSGHQPVWLCDPCHGNTFTAPGKIKTRAVGEMISEMKSTHLVHLRNGSKLNGLHLEQTGEDATECVDGARENAERAEFSRYTSLCDPRLSRKQALDVVDAYVEYVKGQSVPQQLDLLLGNSESVSSKGSGIRIDTLTIPAGA